MSSTIDDNIEGGQEPEVLQTPPSKNIVPENTLYRRRVKKNRKNRQLVQEAEIEPKNFESKLCAACEKRSRACCLFTPDMYYYNTIQEKKKEVKEQKISVTCD